MTIECEVSCWVDLGHQRRASWKRATLEIAGGLDTERARTGGRGLGRVMSQTLFVSLRLQGEDARQMAVHMRGPQVAELVDEIVRLARRIGELHATSERDQAAAGTGDTRPDLRDSRRALR
jgi:hypothetical protein